MPYKRLASDGPEAISPTGISWFTIKCRLDAGASPSEVAACIHKSERDVRDAMKFYKMKERKARKSSKRGQYGIELIAPDGTKLRRNRMLSEERALQIYALVVAHCPAWKIHKILGINDSTVSTFILKNDI
jgi:hypothetical protein